MAESEPLLAPVSETETEDERESLLTAAPRPQYHSTDDDFAVDIIGPSNERGRRGYEQRRVSASLRKGGFIDTEFGSYLALADAALIREEVAADLEHPVSVTLHRCRKSIIRPYEKLLLTVGWKPVFEDADVWWKKGINIIHPTFVICLVLLGYIIQYAACFRRDSAIQSEDWADLSNASKRSLRQSGIQGNQTGAYVCHEYIISQYIIPDILHSIAYGYSFYLLRIKDGEHLPTLMERVFLQTSPTQTGYLSQSRLITAMKLLLYISVAWVMLSLAAQVIHTVAQYNYITFSWMTPSTTLQRAVLLALMLLGFVALDVVYSAVVINYCVQCALLIFYIEGLQEQLRQCLITLTKGMREIACIEVYLRHLNYNTAVALSLVVFNFCTMAVLGLITILTSGSNFSYLMYISSSLSVIFWATMVLVPVIQAARLSAGCNSLRKVGHEIRLRPFGYRDTSDGELDSFMLYTSSLNLRAKLLFIPVRTYFLSAVISMSCFVILLLFQTGRWHLWL